MRSNYIYNPNYKAPFVQTVATILKMAGRGITGIGAASDAINLYDAYQVSQETNDNKVVVQEGIRIVASWTGAVTIGTSSAKVGMMTCAAGGPWGLLICGGAFGLAGSVAGYMGGGYSVNNLVNKFDHSAQAARKHYRIDKSVLRTLTDIGVDYIEPFIDEISLPDTKRTRRSFTRPDLMDGASDFLHLQIANGILHIPEAGSALADSVNRLSRAVSNRVNKLLPESYMLVRQEVDYAIQESIDNELALRSFRTLDELVESLAFGNLGASFTQITGNVKIGNQLNKMARHEFAKAMTLGNDGHPKINKNYSPVSQHKNIDLRSVENEIAIYPSFLTDAIVEEVRKELEITSLLPNEYNVIANEPIKRIYNHVSNTQKKLDAERPLDPADQAKLKKYKWNIESAQAIADITAYVGIIGSNERIEKAGRILGGAIGVASTVSMASMALVPPVAVVASFLGFVVGAMQMSDDDGPTLEDVVTEGFNRLERQADRNFKMLWDRVSTIDKNVLTLMEGFRYGLLKIAKDFQLARVMNQYNHERTEHHFHQVKAMLNTGFGEIWMAELNDCFTQINTENLATMSYEDYKKHETHLQLWMLGRAGRPLSAGNAIALPDQLTPEVMDYLIIQPDFLKAYVENNFKISLSDIPLETIGNDPSIMANIANARLWLKLAKETIKLRIGVDAAHVDQYDPDGTRVDNYIKSGRNIQRFYQSIASNQALFEGLWQDYTQALGDISEMIEQDHAKRVAARDLVQWSNVPALTDIINFKPNPVMAAHHDMLSSLEFLNIHLKTQVESEYAFYHDKNRTVSPFTNATPFYQIPRIVLLPTRLNRYIVSALQAINPRTTIAPLLRGTPISLPNDLSQLERLGLGQFIFTVHMPLLDTGRPYFNELGILKNAIELEELSQELERHFKPTNKVQSAILNLSQKYEPIKVSLSFEFYYHDRISVPVADLFLDYADPVSRSKIASDLRNDTSISPESMEQSLCAGIPDQGLEHKYPPDIVETICEDYVFPIYTKQHISIWLASHVSRIEDRKMNRTFEHEKRIHDAFTEYQQSNLLSKKYEAHYTELLPMFKTVDEKRYMISLFLKIMGVPDPEQAILSHLPDSHTITESLSAELTNVDSATAQNSAVAASLKAVPADMSVIDYVRSNHDKHMPVYHQDIENSIRALSVFKPSLDDGYNNDDNVDADETFYEADDIFYDAHETAKEVPFATSAASSIHSSSVFMGEMNSLTGLLFQNIDTNHDTNSDPTYTPSYRDICSDYVQSISLNDNLTLLSYVYHSYIAPSLSSYQMHILTDEEVAHLSAMLNELPIMKDRLKILYKISLIGYQEEHDWIAQTLKNLKHQINLILKNDRVKSTDLQTIDYKFTRMNETLDDLTIAAEEAAELLESLPKDVNPQTAYSLYQQWKNPESFASPTSYPLLWQRESHQWRSDSATLMSKNKTHSNSLQRLPK